MRRGSALLYSMSSSAAEPPLVEGQRSVAFMASARIAETRKKKSVRYNSRYAPVPRRPRSFSQAVIVCSLDQPSAVRRYDGWRALSAPPKTSSRQEMRQAGAIVPYSGACGARSGVRETARESQRS